MDHARTTVYRNREVISMHQRKEGYYTRPSFIWRTTQIKCEATRSYHRCGFRKGLEPFVTVHVCDTSTTNRFFLCSTGSSGTLLRSNALNMSLLLSFADNRTQAWCKQTLFASNGSYCVPSPKHVRRNKARYPKRNYYPDVL